MPEAAAKPAGKSRDGAASLRKRGGARHPHAAPAIKSDQGAAAAARAATRHGVFIGTSGWHYGSWRGRFFPAELKAREQLQFYAQRFCTTELNGVFYRTPSLETVRSWREQTPDGFVFAWKASKFITHWKRLSASSQNSLELLQTRLLELAPKAGPVLFQLPAKMKRDKERIAGFLKMLPPQWRYAFEFRDPSWYEEEILRVLAERDVALCLSDHHDAPAPWRVTAGHVYIRGHGPGGRYRGNYPEATLRDWGRRILEFARQGHAIYCYFDNDQKSAAPRDAERLGQILMEAPRSRKPGR